MVVFLIKGNRLLISHINYVLEDFFEQYQEEHQILTKKDYEEAEKIRQNPQLLTNSYLFKQIEPFILPFYERKH